MYILTTRGESELVTKDGEILELAKNYIKEEGLDEVPSSIIAYTEDEEELELELKDYLSNSELKELEKFLNKFWEEVENEWAN